MLKNILKKFAVMSFAFAFATTLVFAGFSEKKGLTFISEANACQPGDPGQPAYQACLGQCYAYAYQLVAEGWTGEALMNEVYACLSSCDAQCSW